MCEFVPQTDDEVKGKVVPVRNLVGRHNDLLENEGITLHSSPRHKVEMGNYLHAPAVLSPGN
jgi:hypothetical protein